MICPAVDGALIRQAGFGVRAERGVGGWQPGGRPGAWSLDRRQRPAERVRGKAQLLQVPAHRGVRLRNSWKLVQQLVGQGTEIVPVQADGYQVMRTVLLPQTGPATFRWHLQHGPAISEIRPGRQLWQVLFPGGWELIRRCQADRPADSLGVVSHDAGHGLVLHQGRRSDQRAVLPGCQKRKHQLVIMSAVRVAAALLLGKFSELMRDMTWQDGCHGGKVLLRHPTDPSVTGQQCHPCGCPAPAIGIRVQGECRVRIRGYRPADGLQKHRSRLHIVLQHQVMADGRVAVLPGVRGRAQTAWWPVWVGIENDSHAGSYAPGQPVGGFGPPWMSHDNSGEQFGLGRTMQGQSLPTPAGAQSGGHAAVTHDPAMASTARSNSWWRTANDRQPTVSGDSHQRGGGGDPWPRREPKPSWWLARTLTTIYAYATSAYPHWLSRGVFRRGGFGFRWDVPSARGDRGHQG